MSNTQDQPEGDGYSLVFPFVVCASQGGPYEDTAFVAGYHAGQVSKQLAAAAAVGADRVRVTSYPQLVPQLELIAMHHGFPAMTVEPWDEHPDEWALVTFTTEKEDPEV